MFLELRHELRPMIINNVVWETMMSKNFSYNKLVVSLLLILFIHGIKCVIFINRSTNIRIASKPLESGKFVIKAKEIDCQGRSWIGKDAIIHRGDDKVSLSNNKCHMCVHNLPQNYGSEATKMIE